jgi:hypothetical protein
MATANLCVWEQANPRKGASKPWGAGADTVLSQFAVFGPTEDAGMTAVIETFVYPQAWPTHIQWAAMLLVLLCRGQGKLSFDHLLWQRVRPRFN